jgi:hypothetical protein
VNAMISHKLILSLKYSHRISIVQMGLQFIITLQIVRGIRLKISMIAKKLNVMIRVRTIKIVRNLGGRNSVSLFIRAKIYEMTAAIPLLKNTNSKTGTPLST